MPARLTAPIYESAFAPPALPPTHLTRTRLSRLIRQGAKHRLTIISTPAGYGKTVALTAWRAEVPDTEADVAWLTMTENGSDPLRFWLLVVMALQRAVPEALAGTRARLDRGEPPRGELFICQLVNDLCLLTRDTLLVIDDFRLNHEDTLRDFAALVSHLPPNVHILVACRADPDLPLVQWKTEGTLFEIRPSDLRFTENEAEAFLDLIVLGEIDAEETARLLRRCDGWIAGLHLATLGILESASPGVFIEHLAETPSPIVDYLVAEVVTRLPRDLAAFLKDTAVIEELSGPICNAVTGRSDSAAVLENTTRAGLFVTASSAPGVYHYHPLFKATLLAVQDASRLKTAHSRAASWLMRHNRVRDAIVHVILAGDHAQATKWLLECSQQLLAAGPDELLDLIRRLPADVVGQSCALQSLHLQASMNVASSAQLQQMVSEIESAECDCAHPDLVRVAASSVAGRVEHTLELIDAGAPENAPAGVWDLIAGKALTALERLEEGARKLRTVLDDRTQDPFIDVAAASLLAWNRVMAGHLGAGQAIAERTLKLSSDLGIRWFRDVRFSELALAQIAYDRGLLDEAYRLAYIARDAAGQCTMARLEGAILVARIEWALGNPIHAHQVLSEAVVGADDRPLVGHLSLRVALTQAELHLQDRDADLAESWLPDWRSRIERGARSPSERLVLARFLMADHQYEEARALLAASEVTTDRTSRYLLGAWRLGAIAAAQAQDPVAPMALEIGYAMAAPEGFAQAYVEDSAGLVTVARDGDSGVTAPFALVHNALAGRRAAVSTAERTASSVTLVEQLTDREIAVLRLLPSRLSNREIAHELYVSVNTVKSHVKSIYRKLGVTTRNSAVSKAVALRLM